MKNCEKPHQSAIEEARVDSVPLHALPLMERASLDVDEDGYLCLSGDTLAAFSHGDETTLSYYRREMEGRADLQFTKVLIDPEEGSIFVFLDNNSHLSNERGMTINDYRFLFELTYWLYSKTGHFEFLQLEYAEQGAQMPDRLELEYCPHDGNWFP